MAALRCRSNHLNYRTFLPDYPVSVSAITNLAGNNFCFEVNQLNTPFCRTYLSNQPVRRFCISQISRIKLFNQRNIYGTKTNIRRRELYQSRSYSHTTSQQNELDVKVKDWINDINDTVRLFCRSNTTGDNACQHLQKLGRQFYYNNLVSVPFVERKRLVFYEHIAMQHAQEIEETMVRNWKNKEDGKYFVPPENKNMLRVSKIVEQLQTCNPELAAIKFETYLIDNKEHNENISVLSGGIFTSNYIIENSSDDWLAWLLAHEMGHTVCKHYAETLSNKLFHRLFMSHAVYALLAVVGRTKADKQKVMHHTTTLKDLIQDELLKYPYCDKGTYEYEADKVGLVCMNKAGFDPMVAVEMLWEYHELTMKEQPIFFGNLQIGDQEQYERYVSEPEEDFAMDLIECLRIENHVDEFDWVLGHPPWEERAIKAETIVQKLLTK